MEPNKTQDVKLTEYINSLISDFRILIYLLIFSIISSISINYFLNNYEFKKEYTHSIKIKPYDFTQLVASYTNFLIGGEVITFLNDESSMNINTFYDNPLIPHKDHPKQTAYNFFKIYSDILESPSVKKIATSNLKNKHSLTYDFDLSFTRIYSEPEESSRLYNDYIKLSITSEDIETSKKGILEILNISISQLEEKLLSEINMLNKPKIHLINLMIESLKNDQDIIKSYYASRVDDIVKSQTQIERLLFIRDKFNLYNSDIDLIFDISFENNLSFKIETFKNNLNLLNLILYSLIAAFLLYFLIVYVRAIIKRKEIIL